MQEDRKSEAAELHNKTLVCLSRTHARTHTLLAPAAHWGMTPLVSMHPASAAVSEGEPPAVYLRSCRLKSAQQTLAEEWGAAETALLGFAMN